MRNRSTIAQHAPQRTPRALGQLFAILGIVVAVVLVSATAVSALVLGDLVTTATENSVDLEGQQAPPEIGAESGEFNVLLLGLDVCEDDIKAQFGDRCSDEDAEENAGDRNDVNLLVHVAANPRRVTVVSLPRDLMISHPACGESYGPMEYAQLNAAYGRGGMGCAAKTVSELTGQNVDFAIAVTFGAVIDVTNAIGGVSVCLASPINDNDADLHLTAGEHKVSGYQALAFLRTRYGLVGGSDLSRIANQQQYMSSLVRQLRSRDVLSNPATLLKLANIAVQRSTLSSGLDPMRMVQIVLAVKDVQYEDIVFLQYPVFDDPDTSGKLVVDEAAAATMWQLIAENKQLKLTNEFDEDYSGVVLATPAPSTDPAEQPSAGPSTETPSAAVTLPSNVRGNDAGTATCSNGAG
ncbi:MAG: LCP family protein [Microbacterium sp.]